MDKNLLMRVALAVAVLGLAACSSEPAKTTEAKTDTDVAKKAPAGHSGAGTKRQDGIL